MMNLLSIMLLFQWIIIWLMGYYWPETHDDEGFKNIMSFDLWPINCRTIRMIIRQIVEQL